MQTKTPPAWLGVVSWLPVVLYFVFKYVVIGREAITTRQHYLLIGFVILAEIALWQYRRTFRNTEPTNEDHGTDA